MKDARVAGALLAAGASRRLGRPKQLLDPGDGVPLVRRLAEELKASGCFVCTVVLGASATAVRATLSGLDLQLLYNTEWEEGLASSVRTAVRWADQLGAEGLLLAVCDQPELRASHLRALLHAFSDERSVAASGYANTTGVPALFGRAWFSELVALRGDRGAGTLLRTSLELRVIAWPEGALDLDDEEDVARWQKRRPTPGT